MMRGVTLLETMIVMLVVGFLSGLAALAFGRPARAAGSSWRTATLQARDSAIRSGRVVLVHGDSGRGALFLSDGRVIGAPFNLLTGRAYDAAE